MTLRMAFRRRTACGLRRLKVGPIPRVLCLRRSLAHFSPTKRYSCVFEISTRCSHRSRGIRLAQETDGGVRCDYTAQIQRDDRSGRALAPREAIAPVARARPHDRRVHVLGFPTGLRRCHIGLERHLNRDELNAGAGQRSLGASPIGNPHRNLAASTFRSRSGVAAAVYHRRGLAGLRGLRRDSFHRDLLHASDDRRSRCRLPTNMRNTSESSIHGFIELLAPIHCGPLSSQIDP